MTSIIRMILYTSPPLLSWGSFMVLVLFVEQTFHSGSVYDNLSNIAMFWYFYICCIIKFLSFIGNWIISITFKVYSICIISLALDISFRIFPECKQNWNKNRKLKQRMKSQRQRTVINLVIQKKCSFRKLILFPFWEKIP